MKKPVLFLIFNRPDTTQVVFDAIRKAKPPRLYVASDGPRTSKDGEWAIVEKTRRLVLDSIDWECEVKTLFRDENLGCGKAVSGAITWFFENEKDGIILEDDCLPNQSFFTFCEELLDYYKDNKKIMHISGDQFIPDFDNGASYYFAKVEHCWGWATWADRWQYFKYDLHDYDEKNIAKFSNNKYVQKYWFNILRDSKLKVHRGEFDVWDYQWALEIARRGGFCINPSKNLISNIGFGSNSTHTDNEHHQYANLPNHSIENIIHPKSIEIDKGAVDYIYKNVFGIKMNKYTIKEILKYMYRRLDLFYVRHIRHLRYRFLKFDFNKQLFNPSLLGIFSNPFYFARKGLYSNISYFSNNLSGRLLDIGCGSKPYKELFMVDEYVGLEYDTKSNRQHKNAEYFYDGNKFPFENESFDSVVSFQVLEHVPSPGDSFKEINRVLKRGGLFLLSAPLVWDEHEQPYDYFRYTSFGIRQLASQHGFEVVEIKKSVDDISVIFQLFNDYVYKKIIGKGNRINRIMVGLFTVPSNIIGLLLANILPKNEDLYLDNVVLLKKISKI